MKKQYNPIFCLVVRVRLAYCKIELQQEGAKVEAARVRLTNDQEQEPTSKDLAKAMGMKMRSIDKMLCKKRESQERISRSYRRLVSSIASAYQGKGLSFQDLIQVLTYLSPNYCFPIMY